jgi:hypothetical protein
MRAGAGLVLASAKYTTSGIVEQTFLPARPDSSGPAA